MAKKYLLLLTLPFLSYAQPTTQLQTRDLAEGSIATSHQANRYGDCTSYLYYGESETGGGGVRSCWAAAMSCDPLNPNGQAIFVVGNADYTYTKQALSNLETAPFSGVYDMRASNKWICATAGTVWNHLSISTYLETNIV